MMPSSGFPRHLLLFLQERHNRGRRIANRLFVRVWNEFGACCVLDNAGGAGYCIITTAGNCLPPNTWRRSSDWV